MLSKRAIGGEGTLSGLYRPNRAIFAVDGEGVLVRGLGVSGHFIFQPLIEMKL